MLRFRPIPALCALAATLGLAGPVVAQAPGVTTVFPGGAQQGTSRAVKINGANLQGANQIVVSGTGVKAEITSNKEGGSLPVQVSVAADAAPGIRELRVVTPQGTSNAGRIWVGGYPDGEEKEPNNTLAASQKLESLPQTVDGAIGGGEDVDSFQFQAGANETLVFDVVAFQMASGLDPYIALYDAKGRVLAWTMEGFDRDPRLVFTTKQAGTYTVQIRDSMFRGGATFMYRLTVGRLPVITGYLPRGGRRGETVQVQLQGLNLGEMKTVDVSVPMEGAVASVYPRTAMGPTMNSVSLLASSADDVTEFEPNNTRERASVSSSAPVALSGRIDRAGDMDFFRFRNDAAANLAVEVQARRFGSRLDSELRIYDAAGKELQSNDDALGRDSRLILNAQANVDYFIEVRSKDGRGGDDYFYRIEIAPPAGQDFQLTVEPDELNIAKLGSTQVTVVIQRQNGFGGPVDLRVDGLPAGISLSAARINAGGANAVFTLTGGENVTPGAFSLVRVVGKASIGGQDVERVAQPIEKYAPPLAQPNQTLDRHSLLLPAGVMPQQAYALQIEPKALTIKKGTQNVEVKVKATRLMGQTAQIVVSAANLPGNVTAPNVNIPANQNEIVLKINVAANAPEGTQNVIIAGNLSNNVQTAPALSLTITP